jgi:ring-1,2-phenylacetyl-CoA epoxidase subunit PaaC
LNSENLNCGTTTTEASSPGSVTDWSFILHLADNALILGQRNAEWCGHGPVLEQDIAITNISLDLVGQARNFYQHAALMYNGFDGAQKKEVDHLLPKTWKTYDRELTEDDLAFLREERQYLNLLITELPKGDWAQTVLRQFLFSTFQHLQFRELMQSPDSFISSIAEKSIKEVNYHLRWSGEWVIRLADGTEESRRRIQTALQEIWPFTGEFFLPAEFESSENGFDPSLLKNDWIKNIEQVFSQGELDMPKETKWFQKGGKEGIHTEHLGYLLTDLQYLQRTYPNATW